ncbi:MAG TPA: WD40 repeat domain-containing protein [Polyangiaceae bacterium]|nr:WD40 repeat domain-containing protein [Polyangiaceae bacterium]
MTPHEPASSRSSRAPSPKPSVERRPAPGAIVLCALLVAACGSPPRAAEPASPERAGAPPPPATRAPEPEAAAATASPPTPPPRSPTPEPLSLGAPKLLHVLRHEGDIFSLAFDPTGQWIATGCADKRVRLWSTVAGKLRHTFKDHRDAVSSVAFRPDGGELASGSFDGTAKTWDPKTGKRVATVVGPEGGVVSVAYSKDGRRLAMGGANGHIVVADLGDETARIELAGHGGSVRSVAFARAHDWLLSRADDGLLLVWDLTTTKPIVKVPLSTGAVWSARFTTNDASLVTTWENADGATVGSWDAGTGKLVRALPVGSSLAPSIALSADDRLLAVGTAEGHVKLWDFPRGERLFDLAPFRKNVSALGVSPDGHYVAAGGPDDLLDVWELGVPGSARAAEPADKKDRAACLAECRHRNAYADCADESGMVACPCRCD